MTRKTFLDDDFYKNSMVTQNELAIHWGMAPKTLTEFVTMGIVKKNKLNKISMKHIMDLEELGVEELGHISMNNLMRENNKLKQENERLESIISEVKTSMEVILGGN